MNMPELYSVAIDGPSGAGKSTLAKAAAAALLGDFRAVAAAGLRGCASAPLTADAARRALSLADAAIQRLAAQVNPKITLSVLAAKLG